MAATWGRRTSSTAAASEEAASAVAESRDAALQTAMMAGRGTWDGCNGYYSQIQHFSLLILGSQSQKPKARPADFVLV